MEANFVDLRTKSKEIIATIRRNERITLLYRGKPAATIVPYEQEPTKAPRMPAEQHEAFGIWANREDMKDVDAYVRKLRRGRFDDF